MIHVAQDRLSKTNCRGSRHCQATVKVNRSRLMRKMNPRSLRELGRMADKLKLVPEKPQSF
jgi:FixJ family two-component response regulator